jgi:hypothetical protein
MRQEMSESEARLRAQFDFSQAERGKFHARYVKGQRVTLLDEESAVVDPLASEAVPEDVDAQIIEVLGRNLLISRLTAAGLEVAQPIRDKGVDLIAYNDIGDFVAYPIQLKASSRESFSLHSKYEKIPHLLMAYVWNVQAPDKTEVYAMTFDQAKKILELKKYDQTESWKNRGYYFVRDAGTDLKAYLEPYKMSARSWRDKLAKAG